MRVLLVTDGVFHPPFFARMELHKTLAAMGGYSFQHVRSMERLPDDLKTYSALVIYIHHKKITDSALAALETFVSSGGGLLAIHSATASFKETRPYFEILGGRFIGHGPVGDITVERSAFSEDKLVRDEIFGDIGGFIVKDELYLHEIYPGIEVQFTAKHNGEDVPVVWTYRYGKGRVCYAVPGHRTATMHQPIYRRILQRGLWWVCGK